MSYCLQTISQDSVSDFIFTDINGHFISGSSLTGHAKKFFRRCSIPYQSECSNRKLMMTLLISKFDMSLAESIGGWSAMGAARLYVSVNKDFRFHIAQNIL